MLVCAVVEMEQVTYEFGPFQVNVDSLQLIKDLRPVALAPKTFDTLVLLLRNRHRVVTKDELLKVIWRDAIVSEDSLSQCISTLRRTLGDDSTQPAYIATVPRRGYRFIAPVSEAHAPSEQTAMAIGEHIDHQPPPATVPQVQPRFPWRAIAFALIALGAGVGLGFRLNSGSPAPLRLNLQPPLGAALTSGAVLSPNGRMAAYLAEEGRSGRPRLWVTALGGGEPRALPGTEGATQPFWSPDGRFLGFFAAGALKTTPIADGSPRTLAQVGIVPAGASWSRNGTILFASFRASINAVPEAGGAMTPVTAVDLAAGDRAHEWPAFLADGRRFLFSVDSADPERAGSYIGSLDGAAPRRLVADQHAIYAPPGYLLYLRDRTLMAQPFDAEGETVGGAPTMIAGNVTPPTVRNGAAISAAANMVAFGGGTADGRLIWLGRQGQHTGRVTATGELHNPVLLAGGDRVLADGGGVWLADLARDTTTRLVADGNTPIASADGTRLVFSAVRASGVSDLYLKSLGNNGDELLLHTGDNMLPNDWTRDGQFVVFVSRNPHTGRDIWLLPMTGPRTPIPFSTRPGNEIQAQVSPDGRAIAYASDESGAWEVYVESFPKGGNRRAISAGGGAKPQWRADGRELFYLTPDRMVVAAPVAGTGDIGRPRPLFQAPIVAELNTYRSQFAADAGGTRFLVDGAEPGGGREPVTVLVDWTALLDR